MTEPVNRRRFLSQTAATGVGLAFAQSARKSAAADSPSDSIAVGVMGVNGRGAGLARGFASRPGVRLAYVCDVDRRAAEAAAMGLSSMVEKPPEVVEDFRRVLDDKEVDVLVIAAPDHWHGPGTILACSAGKHVYVEKPACHNGQEGEWMIEAARKHGRVVQMGSQRRSSPGIIEAIGRVHAGEIGRVLFARGWINSARPSIGHGALATPPSHLNYELWQGPAPETPYRDNVVHYHWHWFWRWGTGELGNNGIHALDVCRWGLQVDYPTRVICGGGKYFFDDDQETPDTQLATFHFGEGPQGGKAIHWEHRTWSRKGLEGSDFGVVFYGDAGSLSMTGSDYAVFDKEGKETSRSSAKYNDVDHIDDFLTAIRESKRPRAEIEEGVKSTALCHLGNIAYRVGRTVQFDPTKRVIVGDPEAAALWTREYRPGWTPKV